VSQLIGGAGGLGWVAAKAVLMFAVAVVGLRLGERRTLAQLGAFDFAVAVAIGSIIGRTVTASDTSFLTDADVHALLRQQGVDDLGRVGYLLYETRGATTLVSADREPGPLTRVALSSAGFDHAIDRSARLRSQ
jgi:uncharacterized membrane protein YcaP (DUF421 family)